MDVSIVVGAAVTCFAGGLFPWIASEVAVVAASLVLPKSALPGLVLACAAGQMMAKCALYVVSRWAPHRLPAKARGLLERTHRYGGRPRALTVAAFSGAVVALPPFYLITVACGVLRVPFPLFGSAGFAGTVLRYGLLAWVAVSVGA